MPVRYREGLKGVRWIAAIFMAVTLLLFGCVPASSIRVEVSPGTRTPPEFKTLLVQAAVNNGFIPDVYSDVIPGEAPFRDLGGRRVATFSFSQPRRLSIELRIDPSQNKADFWVVEQNDKLSHLTIEVAERVLRQLRADFGADNVLVTWRSEGES